jgi:hypothetical protein
MDDEQNTTIIKALQGKRITDVSAPYGGTVGVRLSLDDGSTVWFDPDTSFNEGAVLRVELDGETIST